MSFSDTIAIRIKDGWEISVILAHVLSMAAATDYSSVAMPRVRVLCAVTGVLIYEPTHPWLEQVRIHFLKKWT